MKLNLPKQLKNLTPLSAVFIAFIVIEAVIFVDFNILVAVQPDDPIYLKYTGVLICLAVAAAMIYFYGKDSAVLTGAIFFTSISDLFILVIDSYYEIGVTTFFIAQSIYLYRLYADRLNKVYITLIVRAVLAAITITILGVCVGLNYLLVIVSLYFVMLVGNCVDAFIICRGGFKNILFAIGLLLFVCCDICVGLHNFGSALGVALPKGLILFAQYAIWVFYLPSQVMIVCSVRKGGLKIGKGENDEGVQAVQAA